MKPSAAILLVYILIILCGCSAPRYISYDKLKPHHYVARVNQKDYTVIQINHPREVRAIKSNDYLELYHPRKLDEADRTLLISIPADEILDIYVSKSNNPNAIDARYVFWDSLLEIFINIFLFGWL